MERVQRDRLNAHQRVDLLRVGADLAGEIQQAGVSRLAFGFRKVKWVVSVPTQPAPSVTLADRARLKRAFASASASGSRSLALT